MNFESFITHRVSLKRNELLLSGSKVDDNAYFIFAGTLRAYVLIGEKEQNVRFAYSGDIVTHIDSFFQEQPSQYYIEAIKACEIGVIPKANVLKWVNESVENLKFWNELLTSHLLGALDREMDLLIEKPEERIARVLLRSPRLFQEIPLRHIANYLRMTPETLSRIRK